MAIYRGQRMENGGVVTVDGRPLDPRNDLKSFAGAFEWGYSGSGPYQLALALLAHHRGDQEALQHYKDLCETLVEELQGDGWSFDGSRIDASLEGSTRVPMNLKELLDKVRRGG